MAQSAHCDVTQILGQIAAGDLRAAELLGIAERTAYRNWSFARAWLYERLKENDCVVVGREVSATREGENVAVAGHERRIEK